MFQNLSNARSYLASSDSHSLVFHMPKGVRRLGFVLMAVITAPGLMLILIEYDQQQTWGTGSAGGSSQLPLDFPLFALCMVALLGPFIALFVFMNTPYRLSLDLVDRSYTLERGYRPFVRTLRGPFSDIDRLEFGSKYQSGSMRMVYSIGLAWRKPVRPKKWPIMLGTTYDKQEAETLLRQYADALGVRATSDLNTTGVRR